VHESYIILPNYHDDGSIQRLKNVIFKEFINSFDTKNNVLYFSYTGLYARERQKVTCKINQFNVSELSAEIKKVIVRKKKRGYAFVGVPGTGKSTIIRKLEGVLRDYPIVYISPSNFGSQTDINRTFTTITYIQPCIVILEDLDSFDFKKKSSRLGTFLDKIDDVNKRLNAVFIATINDTDLVHYTLINRPGRFDQVMMVRPPSDPVEVYDVMAERYRRNKETEEYIKGNFLKWDQVSSEIFKSIIDQKFTQADICEVVEKALLINPKIDNDTLGMSVRSLIASKKAIKECNFHDTDPFEVEDSEDACCEEVPANEPVAINIPN